MTTPTQPVIVASADAPEEYVRIDFDPDRVAWRIQPHPMPPVGPAGTDRLTLTRDVEFEVDAAQPHRFLSCTLDLPTNPTDPAPRPGALRLMVALFGADVADVVAQPPLSSAGVDEPRRAPWSVLPLSRAGAADRTNVCALVAIHALATSETYPNPWWAADMVIPANGCSLGCGLSQLADRFARTAAQAYTELTDTDTARLRPDIRQRLDSLAPVLEHLVPGQAAAIRIARARVGQPAPQPTLSDDEIRARASNLEYLEHLLGSSYERDLAGVLGAAPSTQGITLSCAVSLHTSADPAALAETKSFTPPLAMAGDLPEQLQVRLYPVAPERPHALLARLPLRPGVKTVRAWIRLGVVIDNQLVELVTESQCWMPDRTQPEAVAELVLHHAVSPRDISALRIELADEPTWPTRRDTAQRRRTAEKRILRGQADEALGEYAHAALNYEDATRRYGELGDRRLQAEALEMAKRAWLKAENPAAAQRVAEQAAGLGVDVAAPPQRHAYLGEWFEHEPGQQD